MDENERKEALREHLLARANLEIVPLRVTDRFAVVSLPLAWHWPDFMEAMEEIGWELVHGIGGGAVLFRKSR